MTGTFQENYRFVRKPAPAGTTDIWRMRPVFVALEGLRQRGASGRDEAEREPRYTVTISWGRHYEPWVRSVRRT